jgi:hypothetical protein
VELVESLFRDTAWREYVLETVALTRPDWFVALDDRGLFREFLDSEAQADHLTALRLMRGVVDSCGDRIAALLAPCESRPDPWPRLMAAVLFADGSTDTRALYELRLRLIARGAYPHVPVFPSGLIADDPSRCVEWLAARLQREIACRSEANTAVNEGTEDRHAEELDVPPEDGQQESKEDDEPATPLPPDCDFDLNIHRADTLNRLAAGVPRSMWDHFVPQVLCLSELTRRSSVNPVPGELFQDSFWARPVGRRRLVEPPDLVAALALAGAILALDDATFLDRAVETLSSSEARTAHRLLAQLFLLLPESVADRALSWLCERPARFALGDQLADRWRYARELIEQLAPTCSDPVYARLEETLLAYHHPLEYASLLQVRRDCDDGYQPLRDLIGVAQHTLLPALPANRISRQAHSVLAQLRDKFRSEELASQQHVDSRSFVLPLDQEQAARMTDDEWLVVIQPHPDTLQVGPHTNISEAHFTSHDPFHCAHVLGLLARQRQGRCADLALRLPHDAHPRYLLEILHALDHREPPNPTNPGDWEPATHEQVANLATWVGYRENEDMALAWCWMVRKWSEIQWPQAGLEILCRYATEHPDPGPGDRPVATAEGVDLDDSRLNCVRGAAVGGNRRAKEVHPQVW